MTRLVLLFDIAMKDVELSPNTKDRRLLTMQREQAGRKGVMIGIDGKLVARSKRRMKQSRKRTAVPEEGIVKPASFTLNSDIDDYDNDDAVGPSSAPLPPKCLRARALAVLHRLQLHSIEKEYLTGMLSKSSTQLLRRSTRSPKTSRSTRNRSDDTGGASGTIWQKRSGRCSFQAFFSLSIYLDGKIIADITNTKESELLPIFVSEDVVNKLLGVQRLLSGKGEDVATAFVSCLEDWGVAERVVGMSFNTTASNTCVQCGACTCVQQRLRGYLFHLACRHHNLEIVAEKSFGACLAIF